MIKCVVFDLDGTLLDSKLCFDSMRSDLGIPPGELILEYLDRLDPEVSKSKHEKLKDIELEAALKGELFPGVPETLSLIKEKGIGLGLLTRNCREVVDQVSEKFGLSFDLSIAREDSIPKPDPDGLYKIAKKLECEAEELIYIGDFQFDIECGKRAGAKTGLFTDGRELPDHFGADFVFGHYQEFFPIFGKLMPGE